MRIEILKAGGLMKDDPHALICKSPSRTKVSDAGVCDIHEIDRRARASGLVGHVNSKVPVYADCTKVRTYHEALNVVLKAQDHFASLPSKIRDRFENDPSKLLEFLEDEKNLKEAQDLGLVQQPEVVEVVDKSTGEVKTKEVKS